MKFQIFNEKLEDRQTSTPRKLYGQIIGNERQFYRGVFT